MNLEFSRKNAKVNKIYCLKSLGASSAPKYIEIIQQIFLKLNGFPQPPPRLIKLSSCTASLGKGNATGELVVLLHIGSLAQRSIHVRNQILQHHNHSIMNNWFQVATEIPFSTVQLFRKLCAGLHKHHFLLLQLKFYIVAWEYRKIPRHWKVICDICPFMPITSSRQPKQFAFNARCQHLQSSHSHLQLLKNVGLHITIIFDQTCTYMIFFNLSQ